MKKYFVILNLFLCAVTNSVFAYTLTIKNTTNESLEVQVEYVGRLCAKDTVQIAPKKTLNKKHGLCCIRRVVMRKTSRGSDRKLYSLKLQATGFGASCKSNVVIVSKTPDGALLIQQQEGVEKKVSLKRYTLQIQNQTKETLRFDIIHQSPGVCAPATILVQPNKQKIYRTPQPLRLIDRLTTRCCIKTIKAMTVSGKNPGITKTYEPSKTTIWGGSCQNNAIVVYENPDGSLRIEKK